MTPDVLKTIITEVFAALATATAGNPFIHVLVGTVEQLALTLLPTILGNLTVKGVAVSK